VTFFDSFISMQAMWRRLVN